MVLPGDCFATVFTMSLSTCCRAFAEWFFQDEDVVRVPWAPAMKGFVVAFGDRLSIFTRRGRN